ncbi:ATP-binding protein [Streptomyces sp. NPDC059861]|uniref:ATP-binding protein n=1 Tax=Streptomyces sp. NPDC059861 TaxID=3346974 RepID=UPI0036672446
MDYVTCMPKKSWDLAFLAEPQEVALLRRALRMNLAAWGLQELSDSVQVCVSELVSNVINHVGSGTPATLSVSLLGMHLRIEIQDPDTRALPMLRDAHADVEAGRGMALVDALADRWGVYLLADRKVTWCEFATGPTEPSERVAGIYRQSRLRVAAAEAASINVIAEVLLWLQAHGHDADEMLDRAQRRFEAECAYRERPRSLTQPRSPSTSTRPPESGASAAT